MLSFNCIAKRATLIASFMLATASANAQTCFICDDLVTLNDRGTDCFLAFYEEGVSHAKQAGSATIDLTPCTGATGDETRGSIDKPLNKIGQARAREARKPLRASYVLDLAGLECLRKLIDQEARPMKEPVTFDLLTRCSSR